MGFPMTYERVIKRNQLDGDYDASGALGMIRGDLRRFERDWRHLGVLGIIAKDAGASVPDTEAVITAFLGLQWGLRNSAMPEEPTP